MARPIPDLCQASELSVKQGFAIARQFYEAAFGGAWEKIEDMLSDDFVIREAESLPFHAVYHGKSGLRDLYAYMTGYWTNFRAELKAVTVGDNYIVGLLEASGTAKSTGRSFSMPIAEIIRLREGKIVEIYPIWWDTMHVSNLVAK